MMSRLHSKDSHDPAPAPRRRRWVLLSILLLIIAIPVGHALWREHEWRKLHAMIDRHRAMGEPVLPEDFNGDDITGAGNPATQWIDAAAAVPPSAVGHDWRHDPLWGQTPLTAKEVERLLPVLEQSATALARAKAAAANTGRAKWPVRFTSPAIFVPLPELIRQRNLARLLRSAALDAHRRGDDAEAVERVHEILAQSHAFDRHPTSIAHLVANGLNALGSSAAADIAPDLHVGPPHDGRHPATSEQVRQVIDELLDDRPLHAGQRLALLTERMAEADAAQWVAAAKGNPANGPSSASAGEAFLEYLGGPLFYRDGQLMFERMTRLLAVADASDWQTCRAQLNTIPDLGAYGRAHFLMHLLEPATGRMFLQDFRTLANAHATATMLACWWYSSEHAGKLPQDLNQLVPRYLTAVPADPFAVGAPMKYRPDANDPVVYSTGEDGKDDGASTRPSDRTTQRRPTEWDTEDYVLHLKRQPREPEEDVDEQQAEPAATQPETAPATEPS